MSSPLFFILAVNILTIFKTFHRERGWKYAFWKKIATASFQLKTALDNNCAVAVDSNYDLNKTKRVKFEDF